MATSKLVFDPDTGIIAPSTAEMREAVASALQECFKENPDDPLLNTEPSSPMGQFVDLLVAEKEAKNTEITQIINMVDPNISTGKFLDAIVALYGVDRKVSESTIVTCKLTGLQDTFIPYGVIVQDSEGNQFRHNAALGCTIGENGEVETTFSAVKHGPLIVQPESITKIITVIAGWDTVTNPLAGVTGRDEETDAEVRTRTRESYAINAHGTVENIESNLKEIPGVLDCKVLENFTGSPIIKYGLTIEAHSIAVCIVGGEDEEIAEIIYRRKDCGCGTTGSYEVVHVATDHFNAVYRYKITRPTDKNLKIKVSFFGKPVNDFVQAQIKQSILDDCLGKNANDRIRLASTVYSDRFYAAVKQVTDEPIKEITFALGDEARPEDFKNALEIKAEEEPVISIENIELDFAEE